MEADKMDEILISKPIFSEKVWGSEELNKLFGRKKNEFPLGEIWLYSPVENNETELFGLETGKYYGKPSDIFPDFKILIKLISSSEWLSVQVHPDDKTAEKLENQENGKSECWYFLRDGGQIKVSNENEKILKSLETNDFSDSLKDRKMNKNDLIYIPAGTVHTLGPGSFMLEAQQSSDLTYRLYDWGRPREIHIEKTKEVLKTVHTSYSLMRNTDNIETKYFSFHSVEDTEDSHGIFVSLKDFTTVILSENQNYFFSGKWIKYTV